MGTYKQIARVSPVSVRETGVQERVVQETDPRPQEENDEMTETDKLPWKVLIVDDDQSVHAMTRLVLADLVFQERGLEFYSAHSAGEARDVMAEHPDMSLIFLDVILERSHAGLDLVDYIRTALHNQVVQIILRTGQPGRIPEESVILNYDVNGYKEKTELNYQRLLSVTIAALRSCARLRSLEDSHRLLLERNENLEKELARVTGTA